jgi:hypothetical protein
MNIETFFDPATYTLTYVVFDPRVAGRGGDRPGARLRRASSSPRDLEHPRRATSAFPRGSSSSTTSSRPTPTPTTSRLAAAQAPLRRGSPSARASPRCSRPSRGSSTSPGLPHRRPPVRPLLATARSSKRAAARRGHRHAGPHPRLRHVQDRRRGLHRRRHLHRGLRHRPLRLPPRQRRRALPLGARAPLRAARRDARLRRPRLPARRPRAALRDHHRRLQGEEHPAPRRAPRGLREAARRATPRWRPRGCCSRACR